MLLVSLTEHPRSLAWSLSHRRTATCKYFMQGDTQASEMLRVRD